MRIPMKHIQLAPGQEWSRLSEEMKRDVEVGIGFVADLEFNGGDLSVVHSRDVSLRKGYSVTALLDNSS